MQSPSFKQGFFAAIAPAIALVLGWLHAERAPGELVGYLVPVAVALTALDLLGTALLGRAPRLARLLLTVALTGFAIAALPAMLARPALTLVLLLGVGSLLVWAWSGRAAPASSTALDRCAERVQGAGLGLFAMWFMAIPVDLAFEQLGWAALLGSSVVTLLFAGQWAWLTRRTSPAQPATLVGGLLLALGLVALLRDSIELALSLVCLLPLVMAAMAWNAWRREHRRERLWWEPVFDEPARLLVVTFFVTATLGGFLLALPVASLGAERPALIDTLFTAFSATCVTGLVVLDTPNVFSGIGQVIILVLIQIGGLGIMTFSTAALALLGRRMSLRHEATIANLLSDQDRSEIHHALRQILVVTFTTEALGGLVLAALFRIHGDTLGQALWRGLFTAISAFCNAGFSLQSDNLVAYQSSPAVLHTVALIIVVGGLSPAVVALLPRLLRGRRVPLQAMLVLVTTAVLLVAPAMLILAIEWTNTLAGMSLVDRLSNAWLQSVTLRTAGFNSIDLAAVHPATLAIMIIVMFIGGSPGSTAGGIKTTTVALLLLVVLAALRGRDDVTAFGYRIPARSVFKAAAVATLGMLSVLAALLALLITQPLAFDVALFEVVSAAATVGLTIGGTAALDNVGKTIIILSMFAGRVGPLTLFLLLTGRDGTADWARPEQPVNVG